MRQKKKDMAKAMSFFLLYDLPGGHAAAAKG